MPRRVLAALLLCLGPWVSGAALAADDLRLGQPAGPSLKARVHLVSSDDANGSRLLGAHLLGDYYPWQDVNGLRLSGGLLMGPASLMGSGLAPTGPSLLGMGNRRLLGRTASEELNLNQPYLGIGFSRYGSSWGFSADLGVAVNGSALRSSQVFARSIDDSLRRLQWTPMLQLGVSYRF